jgi:uncharacterized protein (DUF1800 family)
MDRLLTIDPTWAWQPYVPSSDRPWTRALAAHLYRRSGFGASPQQLDEALQQEPMELVQKLLTQNVEEDDFRSIVDNLARTILASGDAKKLSAAWVYRILLSPAQILEKVTLFWHGHFATSAEKVNDARMMWDQNQLLRNYALGNFAELVQAIAKDPAMLIYLDSAINRKAHPNENFARELMELFCLGEGSYSERDVQELARCFTGWEVKNKKFRKNRYQQDTGSKSILAVEGTFDGEDGVRVVLEQPQLERFLARKWFRFFISDEPEPSDELLQPLAIAFRKHDLKVAPVLQMLFSSNLFFSSHAMYRKIKSPVELVVGTLRGLSATTNTEMVASGLLQIGQGLFYPPSVKGWDGGRAWINSSTMLGRTNLIGKILENEVTRFGSQNLEDYLAEYGVTTAGAAIDFFEQCFSTLPLDESTKVRLTQTFSVTSDEPERQLRSLLHAFTSLPQYQLG